MTEILKKKISDSLMKWLIWIFSLILSIISLQLLEPNVSVQMMTVATELEMEVKTGTHFNGEKYKYKYEVKTIF